MPQHRNISFENVARSRPTVLITGFGPFPGVPHNLSGDLARRLAIAAQSRFRGVRIVSEVLPVSWDRAPHLVARLVARHRPSLALHFGVSAKATGFVIETCGRNIAVARPDCSNATPSRHLLIPHGAAAHDATIPAARIVARLLQLGLPASCSGDAGGYLCNAVLYHSLALAERQRSHPRCSGHVAGFVHIPAWLSPAHLDHAGLLAGSLEILRISLAGIRRT